MASEVTYLGFRINKNGVNALPEKVVDLLTAETLITTDICLI